MWQEYDELLASVIESDKSNPALDRSSGGNFDLSNNGIFGQDQAAGNSASASGNDRAPGAILRNAARYRASEPSPPDHEATFQAATPVRQSQPSNALGFASTWNPFEDPPGQVQLLHPLTILNEGLHPVLHPAPSFASSWNPFEDPPGQGNKSQ